MNLGRMKPEQLIALRDAARSELARRSLREFVRQAWHVVEPTMPLMEGWHLDAVCAHLEAVTRDEIDRLLITIPPGHAKSLLVSVLWPAWTWATSPGERSLFGSYSMDLAVRDSVRCRDLIESDWYQARFATSPEGVAWSLKDDSNAKDWFQNTASGFRVSLSVGGQSTGLRGNLCVAGDTLVATEHGNVKIRDLVAMVEKPRVWGYDHAAGQAVLRKVEATLVTENRQLVAVATGLGGELLCTDDHRIFARGRGYVRAADLGAHEAGLAVGAFSVPTVRQADREATLRGPQKSRARVARSAGDVLLEGVCSGPQATQSTHADLSHLQDTDGPEGAARQQDVLLIEVQTVSEKNPDQSVPCLSQGLSAVREQAAGVLESLRTDPTQPKDDRFREQSLPQGVVLQRAVPTHFGDDSGAGQVCLHELQRGAGLRQTEGAAPTSIADGAPHRRGPDQQQPREPDQPLHLVPHLAPQIEEVVLVGVVRRCEGTHQVFDIQVEGTRNFFADGLLVHNCVVDDPLNVKRASSAIEREAAIRWWDVAMSSRFNDMRRQRRVIIMQRLHEQDLAGHVLEQGGYEHLNLPTRFEEKRRCVTYVRRPTVGTGERERVELFRDPRTTENELLFPALFTEAVVAQAEKDLRGDFFGQHQQRPLPATGGTFKKTWWRFWKPDGTGAEAGVRPDGCYTGPARAVPASFDCVVISLDANFKGNQAKGNDPVVFVVVGCKGADRFVLDRVRLFVGFTETLTAFRHLSAKWPKAFKKLVEAKANGDAIIETLKSEVGGIVPVEPEGGKEARASAVSPQVESGNVYLPDGAPWLDEWVDEFSSFPKGAHDDQVDALSQALIDLLTDNGAARFRALGAR